MYRPGKSTLFTDIIGGFKSFSSFSDTSCGFSQPTTVWGDVRAYQSNSRPDMTAHPDDMDALHTVLIGRSIPRRRAASSPCDYLLIPTNPKNRKAKPLSVEEQIRLTQHIHHRDRIREENRVE